MALLKQLYSQKEFYFICSSEEATELQPCFQMVKFRKIYRNGLLKDKAVERTSDCFYVTL